MNNFEGYWGEGSKKFMYLTVVCFILFCIFFLIEKNTQDSFIIGISLAIEIASISLAVLCFVLSLVLMRRQLEFENKDLSKSDNEISQIESVTDKYKRLGLISEKSNSRNKQ